MDRQMARTIAQEAEEALQRVAERHPGLSVKAAGGTFTNEGAFTLKVKWEEADTEARTFATMAPWFGVDADTYGKTFTHAGSEYAIFGFAPRSSVRPVLARRVRDGKTFKFSEQVLERVA